jgi:hypothetical protein
LPADDWLLLVDESHLTVPQLGAMHAGDDAIVIPKVFHSLSSKRVLCTELLDGLDYATFIETASDEEKSAAGRTIARFMFRALFKYGWLYADPHPGNYRFLGGGRVGFLDFGCVRRLPDELVAGMKRYTRALQDGDTAEFEKACVEVLGYDPTDAEGWPVYTSYTRVILEPIVRDGEFTYTHEFAREAVAYLVRNGRGVVFKEGQTLPSLPKPIHMPPEHTFVNRLQWGLASVLAGLLRRARRDSGRVAAGSAGSRARGAVRGFDFEPAQLRSGRTARLR